jgi:hypothetical protein
VPIRVEYTRPGGGGGAGVLLLEWVTGGSDNDITNTRTNLAIVAPRAAPVTVPSSAFTPTLTAPQVEREAMRRRLYEPVVPWQTYAASSMTGHTLCPTGFVVRFTVSHRRSARARTHTHTHTCFALACASAHLHTALHTAS